MLEGVMNRIRRKKIGKSIGLLIDGPNMLRREFALDLDEIKKKLKEFGLLKIGIVFLNQYAPEKLIEAIVNQGFQPKIVTSDDVDAPMAAEAMEIIFNPHIDILALMTRDADFHSVLLKAKKYGKETIVIGNEPLASALKNTADQIIALKSGEASEPSI